MRRLLILIAAWGLMAACGDSQDETREPVAAAPSAVAVAPAPGGPAGLPPSQAPEPAGIQPGRPELAPEDFALVEASVLSAEGVVARLRITRIVNLRRATGASGEPLRDNDEISVSVSIAKPVPRPPEAAFNVQVPPATTGGLLVPPVVPSGSQTPPVAAGAGQAPPVATGAGQIPPAATGVTQVPIPVEVGQAPGAVDLADLGQERIAVFLESLVGKTILLSMSCVPPSCDRWFEGRVHEIISP